MAQDSVISFGDEKPRFGDERPRRTYLRDLGRDHRIPALTAALGAVAAFGSLVSEWQTTSMNGFGFGAEPGAGARVLPTDLPDLGAVGAGYLAGLLLLTTAVVLTLFGPATGRRHAQLAGLAVGGVLLALLVALMPHLNQTSLLVPRYYTVELTGDDVRVAVGRGLWCALFAVGAALAALWLPHRERVAITPEPEPFDDQLDLTITPTTPFVSVPGSLPAMLPGSSPGELDQPHRS
ncbi:hypothetical protein [Actinoplanes derwentensis]|nr:hypothetical protein [Actinoplanes derwentensis]